MRANDTLMIMKENAHSNSKVQQQNAVNIEKRDC